MLKIDNRSLDIEVDRLRRELVHSVGDDRPPSLPVAENEWTIRPKLLLILAHRIKVKMYQETGHTLPHVHVDLGTAHHLASYGIDPPKSIAGSIGRSNDKLVKRWISKNKVLLLHVWDALQTGQEWSCHFEQEMDDDDSLLG